MLVELFLQLGLLDDQGIEVGVGLGEFGVDGIVAGKHVDDRLHCLPDHLDDSFRFIQLGLLFEQADGVTLGHGDLADVVLVDAGDNAQQRGLARTVQPSTPILAP